jgi:biopolymer transport protein ExbB/TolQ
MTDILMTNIFFMITALSLAIITGVLVIALVYLIRVLRRLDSISQKIENEALDVINDVQEVRLSVRKHVNIAQGLMSASFIKGLVEKLFNSHNGDTYEKRNKKSSK